MTIKLLSAYIAGALLLSWTIAAIFGLGAVAVMCL